MSSVYIILLYILQGILVIAIAPLLLGWLKITKSWCQNRSAASLFQPYFVCFKLLLKTPIVAQNASWLFRFSPYGYMACLSVLAFVVPFFLYEGGLSLWFDVIVLIGIFALARIIMTLAGMDIGSAFGSLGARRELFVACLVEPVLLLVLLNLGLFTKGLTLGHISFILIHKNVLYPGLTFSLFAFILVLLAENGRFPFDNPSTHLELTMIHEAMVLEYSGRYLALVEWGNALKLTLFLLLFINLFFPYGLAVHVSWFALTIGLISTLSKLFILILLLAFAESLQAKIRVFRVPEYLGLALFSALLGILLTQLTGAAT
jgi:formate hydrogenlyase subunit 4